MIILLLIGFGIMAMIQIPSLIQKRWWKELTCFAVLWFVSLVLSIMVLAGITLPPISTIINNFIAGRLGN